METILIGKASGAIVGSNKKIKSRFFLPLGLVVALQFILSMTIPLILFLSYQTYAIKNGIILELGCHGSGVPFSMLSGVLMNLCLRLNQRVQYL